MTNLPIAVHLVAQAPILYSMGLLIAVLDTQITPISTGGMVTVINQIQSSFDASGTQVDGHHRLSTGTTAPGNEFVHTHGVGFQGSPCQVKALGTVFYGTNTILPTVIGNKITTGITNNGDIQFLDQLDRKSVV